MRIPDDALPLNCPLCGVPLLYIVDMGKVQWYYCRVHREYRLDAEGRLRSRHTQ